MAGRRRQPQRDVEWHFFSFPVAFGVALGAFLASLVFPVLPGPVFVVSLFATSFGAAHIISRWFRRRTLDRRRDREEEAERERRALAARAAAAREGEERPPRRRRRRRG